jgi:uncharacterized protein YndB with AHSA1/START domain
MGHDYVIRHQAEVPAEPEQVWQAIASGPGMDAWFMGSNEVEPEPGGLVRTHTRRGPLDSAVTRWDPPRLLEHRTATAPDGRFLAYEFLVEGRDGGSTVLRLATSGFLPGDDWEGEFEAMNEGITLFFRTLIEYLTHFAGRTARPLTLFGGPGVRWTGARARLLQEFGLRDPVRPGAATYASSPDFPARTGTVYHAEPAALAVRTDAGLFRFLRLFPEDGLMLAHHLFDPAADLERTTAEWRSWLDTVNDRPISRESS